MLEKKFFQKFHNFSLFLTLIGDLTAKSKNCYYHDKSSHEGNAIKNLVQFGLQQIIKEATDISNTSSSCIDLIFTFQPSLITDFGVHSSLHPNCHHQILFAKLNLHIAHTVPYLREICHYREANTGLIRRTIKQFNWERAFSNTSVNENIFNIFLIFLIEIFLIFLVTLLHMK